MRACSESSAARGMLSCRPAQAARRNEPGLFAARSSSPPTDRRNARICFRVTPSRFGTLAGLVAVFQQAQAMLDLGDAQLELVPLVPRHEPQLAGDVVDAAPRALAHAHGVAAPARRHVVEERACL